MKLLLMHKVQMHNCAISCLVYNPCVCTGDNPLAEAEEFYFTCFSNVNYMSNGSYSLSHFLQDISFIQKTNIEKVSSDTFIQIMQTYIHNNEIHVLHVLTFE